MSIDPRELDKLTQVLQEPLRGLFHSENLTLRDDQREMIVAAATKVIRPSWSRHYGWAAGLAAIAACLLVAPFLPWFHWLSSDRVVETRPGVTPPVVTLHQTTAPIVFPREDRFTEPVNAGTTFPLRTGNGSWVAITRSLEAGRRPAVINVRLEEVVNHFDYTTPDPGATATFNAASELAICPWNPDHRLLRVTLRAGNGAGIVARETIAHIRFAPEKVAAYRLLGFDETDGDNGTATYDVEAGQTITVLYELVPRQTLSDSFAQLQIHYSDASRLSRRQFIHEMSGPARPLEAASADMQLAAAAAGFAMRLADPAAPMEWPEIEKLAASAAAAPASETAREQRDSFLRLIQLAQTL